MMEADRCAKGDCIERPTIFDRDGGWCRTHWGEREAVRRGEEKQATIDAGGPWPQLCPRRERYSGPHETTDTWDIREQMHQGLRARHCSYCGSLHPDDFMERVRQGWVVGPTDKNYKAYLDSPGGGMEAKFYYQHLSDEQKREFVDLYNEQRMVVSGGGVLPLALLHGGGTMKSQSARTATPAGAAKPPHFDGSRVQS